MIFFTESFNEKVYSFIENADDSRLEKFTVGFHQLLNKREKGGFIDIKELIYFLNKMVSIDKDIKGVAPSEEIAFFLSEVAHIYLSSMMLDMALLFYRVSIDIREKGLKSKSLSMAEDYQSIGSIYEYEGAFDKALVCYKKSLAIRKELSYVENNLLIAESYTRLALAYYYLGYYTIALNYMEDTIRIKERILLQGDILLENSYHNYRCIKKELEPKKDYLTLLLEAFESFREAIISRLVIFK